MLPIPWYQKKLKDNFNSFNEATRKLNYYISADVYFKRFLTGKFKIDNDSYIVPDILCFKITRSTLYLPAADPNFIIRKHKLLTIYDKEFMDYIPKVLEQRINYELTFNKVDRALIYYLKIAIDFPDYKLAAETLKKLNKLK
jgi:hypothetical protein